MSLSKCSRNVYSTWLESPSVKGTCEYKKSVSLTLRQAQGDTLKFAWLLNAYYIMDSLPSDKASLRMASRIPFTKLLLSSVLNTLAISIASEMDTFGGISLK